MSKDNFGETSFLLPLYQSQESNSGHQSWCLMSLLHQPTTTTLINVNQMYKVMKYLHAFTSCIWMVSVPTLPLIPLPQVSHKSPTNHPSFCCHIFPLFYVPCIEHAFEERKDEKQMLCLIVEGPESDPRLLIFTSYLYLFCVGILSLKIFKKSFIHAGRDGAHL